MERTETFTGCDFRYTYDDTLFPPGTDSFLLSSFPPLKPGLRVCDLGCGAGLLGLLLLRREPTLSVCGVELDPAAAQLARHNVEQNRRPAGSEALARRPMGPGHQQSPLLCRRQRRSSALRRTAARPGRAELYAGRTVPFRGAAGPLGRADLPGT